MELTVEAFHADAPFPSVLAGPRTDAPTVRETDDNVASMGGLSGPQEAGAWRFRRFAFASALIVALFGAVLVTPAPPGVKLAVTGVGLVGGSLAMAAGFRMRARLSTGRRRRAWLLFMTTGLLSAVSNLLLVTSYAASPNPNRTVSDVILYMALLIGVAALVTFPLARRRATDLTRMVLDGIVLGGSSLFVASVTLFPRILDNPDTSSGSYLAVPVFDVVIATVATLLYLRGAPQDRPPLGLIAAGCVCYAISDFVYVVRLSEQGLSALGSIADLGWITGYALIAIATRSPGAAASPHRERLVEPSPVAGTAVMFTLFLVAAVLSLVNLTSGTLSGGPAVLWLLVLLAVMARQILLVIDNERLRRNLERLVDERTRVLNQVSQQAELMLASVGDGIYGVDPIGLVTFVNPAAAQSLGYRPEDLIGREAHATFHDTQLDGTPFPVQSCYVTEAIQARRTTNAEDDNYRRSDGLSIPVEVTATPLIDEDGGAIGAVVVFRDVTQRREVDRMKSEFISMVSHELRTPLTAIRGSLGLIGGGGLGELTPSAARMVDIALVSCERLSRLINEILDIERIESGMLSMDLATHPARTLIDVAVGQVQVIAEEAGVRVNVGPTEGVVYADADRVVQTLLNLLGNAIKFSHRGGFVSVQATPSGAFVEFAIRDDGRGIPDDKLDRIFTRFEQVDSSDAREKGGSGLGLSISRSIVERLGGRIWAENNAGSGATFLFTLPAHAPADGVPTARGGANGSEATPSARGENPSVPANSRF
jgi:PAS domain S-box-containing protein